MMSSLFDEARQMVREMPLAAAVFLAAVVLGLGAHAMVMDEADGESLRLVANRHVSWQSGAPSPGTVARLRSRCQEKIPGFTVIVGLNEYSLELSVPTVRMNMVLAKAHGKLAKTFRAYHRSVA